MSDARTSDQKLYQEYCEYEQLIEDEAYCPVCGSFSPRHIQEDDEGPCREARPFSYFSP